MVFEGAKDRPALDKEQGCTITRQSRPWALPGESRELTLIVESGAAISGLVFCVNAELVSVALTVVSEITRSVSDTWLLSHRCVYSLILPFLHVT